MISIAWGRMSMSNTCDVTLNNGVLYVVATPIGNLGDMVPRAVEVLQMVDVIAAEDTRHSARLMKHFCIETPLIAYHDYSDDKRNRYLRDKLLAGQSVALISDAGTPLISDPGYELVNLARQKGIKVVAIPGACALIAALSVSGLPSNRFIFEGFLPAKSVARRKVFEALSRDTRTIIFYESPHRLLDSLKDCHDVMGPQRQAVLARELTKNYETVLEGSLASLLDIVSADKNQQRGEFVFMLKGYQSNSEDVAITEEAQSLMRLLQKNLPTQQAAGIVAEFTGLKKRDLYQWAIAQ